MYFLSTVLPVAFYDVFTLFMGFVFFRAVLLIVTDILLTVGNINDDHDDDMVPYNNTRVCRSYLAGRCLNEPFT